MDDNGPVEDAQLALRVEGQLVVEHHDLGRTSLGGHQVSQVTSMFVCRLWATVSYLEINCNPM